MSKAIVMSPAGRMTIPHAAREMLHAQEGAEFEWEVRDNTLVLRPVVRIPKEDAWAYSPEHLAALDRALQDVREGRVRKVSEPELEALIEHRNPDPEISAPQVR